MRSPSCVSSAGPRPCARIGASSTGSRSECVLRPPPERPASSTTHLSHPFLPSLLAPISTLSLSLLQLRLQWVSTVAWGRRWGGLLSSFSCCMDALGGEIGSLGVGALSFHTPTPSHLLILLSSSLSYTPHTTHLPSLTSSFTSLSKFF